MKVSTEVTPQPFRPFTVSITFNTREEALRWSTVLNFNLSIPDLVFEEHDEQRDAKETLAQEMGLVREAILKHL